MAEDQKNTNSRRSERIGKYEILEYIAKGGMGAVYKARDTDLDRVVALKVLPPDLARQPTMLDRFRREARAAARLRHDNIVAIYDVGEASGTHYLAMEFVAGIDLGAYIHKKGKLSPKKALLVLIQATRALDHAHREGIVHRDIKPANFLLTHNQDKELVVKLADMGLARHTEEEDETRLTRHGMTVGTVDYMSPEQARNSGDADIRSDIYSLGCTFFHMLAGEPPFPKGTLTERLLLHQETPPPDIRQLNPAVPDTLAVILARMIAKKPQERYQTPAELLRDLEHPERAIRAKNAATPVPSLAATPAPAPAGDDDIDLFSSLPASAIAAPAPPEVPTPTPAAASQTTSPIEPVVDDPTYGVKIEPGESLAPVPPPRRVPPSTPSQKKADARPAASSTVKPARSKPAPPPPRPSKARFRDEELEDEDEDEEEEEAAVERPRKSSKASSGIPVPVFVAAGAVVLVIVLLVLGTSSRPRDQTPKENAGTSKVPERSKFEEPPPPPPPPPKVEVSPALMGPGGMNLPVLSQAIPDERPTLATEFSGPFASFVAPPEGVRLVRVSRTAPVGPTSCRSLAEALARTADTDVAIIEIQDQGPLFVPALPAVTKRRLFLRGADGYRPLLAWEGPTGTFLSVTGGALVLDNLDIVAGGGDDKLDKAATLFRLRGADFHARACTFSLAGKQAGGVTLVRLEGAAAAAPRTPLQFRLQRCYARGPSLIALALDDMPAEVLVEDSSLLTSRGPLFEGRSRDDEAIDLRLVRSTLVSAQNLLSWRPTTTGGTPILKGHVLDSILAHSDPAAPEGDMVRLGDGGVPRLMTWQAINGVYAGWKRLLGSDGRSVSGLDLEGWHQIFFYRDTDRSLAETWPAPPPAQPDELPASSLSPFNSALAFAARSSSGAVGCAVGGLPAEPTDWQRRTYDRRPVILLAGNESPGVPPIPRGGDYGGERIDVNQVGDLGAYLQKALQAERLGPRVVFHLAGSGSAAMSPLRVRGVKDLIFYVEPPKANAPPLALELDARGAGGRAAFIDIEDGSLELIGVHIRLPNERAVLVPPYMLKVKGGDLRLARCHLIGPLSRSPDAFRALVCFGGAAATADRPALMTVRDSLLLSGKAVLHLPEPAAQVRARNNVVMSLTSAVEIEGPGSLGPLGGITCVFERNTWALRQGFVAVRPGPEPPSRSDAVVVQVTSEYFVDPFGDQPSQAVLVRYQEPALGRGLLTWLGKKNVFDQRLQGFFAPLGAVPEKQTLKDWLPLWGPGGEVDPLAVGPTQTPRALAVNPDLPLPDRFALPRDPRLDPNQPPAGADLQKLLALWK